MLSFGILIKCYVMYMITLVVDTTSLLGEVTQLGSEVTSCDMNYLLRNESGNAKILFSPIQIDSSKDYARKVGNARSLQTLWKHLFTINEYTHYNIRIFSDSSFSCNLCSLDSICLAIESSN